MLEWQTLVLWRSDACVRLCVHVFVCVCSQVVRLAVEGHGVQVHVDVRVVLAAHPADGRAVEGGPWAYVSLQVVGQRLCLLGADADLREFKS